MRGFQPGEDAWEQGMRAYQEEGWWLDNPTYPHEEK